MLTLTQLRTDKDRIANALKKRGYNDERLEILDQILDLDNKRKSSQTVLDSQLSEQKQIAKSIGQLMQQGKKAEAEAAKKGVHDLKEKSAQEADRQKNIVATIEELLLTVANAPHESVPAGQSEDDNEVSQTWDAALPILSGKALPHWELAKKYNLIDFELGAKITGSGFPLYRGKGARLQRALIAFFLDKAVDAGYEEIIPPYLVNEDSARATGQLPDKEGQMYHAVADNLYLIPTAEVPVTNIYRDVILDLKELPVKLTGHTPCFRREAGSYGADVKGLNRVHQFDKVEIVQITQPENSYNILDDMVNHVKGLMTDLELPYRILRLCGGDLGFTSALTFDFEVYSAAQKKWLEVSSVSNFETFQANRLKLRYKDSDGKKHLAHTLNGSALALARIVAALLENNQTDDGVVIPKVLVPYTKFEIIN